MIIFYHKNCFDGICSAYIASIKYPDATFYPITYGEEFPYNMIGETEQIIMLDFSLPRKDMEWLDKRGNFLCYDHHKTAEENCKGLNSCIFDMNESGASLTFINLFPNENLPNLVRYIKDRDLWLFKEDQSEAINSYIQSFPMDIKKYKILAEDLETRLGLDAAKIGGQSILRYKNTMVEAMCKNVQFKEIGTFNVPYVNASILFSEVGNQLCKDWPEYAFSAYYFDRSGVRQWGLRSIGEFDVSVIAKQYGGGGHKNASGFIEKL